MKTFKHVSYTWLLAQLFHPLIWMMAGLITGGQVEEDILILLVVFGFVFSLPGYLLCIVFFKEVAKMNYIRFVKLLVWCLVTVACIATGFLFICVSFFETRLFMGEFRLVIPGSIAAVLAILCRYQQFIHFDNLQMISDENNMV
jgi:hypothetical protein